MRALQHRRRLLSRRIRRVPVHSGIYERVTVDTCAPALARQPNLCPRKHHVCHSWCQGLFCPNHESWPHPPPRHSAPVARQRAVCAAPARHSLQLPPSPPSTSIATASAPSAPATRSVLAQRSTPRAPTIRRGVVSETPCSSATAAPRTPANHGPPLPAATTSSSYIIVTPGCP